MIIHSNSKAKKLYKQFIVEQPIKEETEMEELFASQINTIEEILIEEENVLEKLPEENKKIKGKKKKK